MKLEDYRDISARCSQCNFCQAACPVFRVKGTENWLARNRLNLIREVLIEKTMEDTPRFHEILETCLLCTGCTQSCSSMVPVDEIIIAARSRIAESGSGISALKKKLISGVAKSGTAMNLMSRAGAAAQKLGLGSENMPQLASKPFYSRLSGIQKPDGEPRDRVAYYAGCGTNLIYPGTGEALVSLLLSLKTEVVIPDGLACCGVPLLAEGDIEGAAAAFRKNVEILDSIECDRIIMECTSCIMMFLKKGAKLFNAEDPVTEKIKSLSGKIENAVHYIHRTWDGATAKVTAPAFTYHIPCHQNKSAGEIFRTAEILTELTGGQYRPMEEPELCCGAGGTYYMKDGALSGALGQMKMDDINGTGAEAVVTECPMCRFYISRESGGKEVLHPIEYMQRAIKHSI